MVYFVNFQNCFHYFELKSQEPIHLPFLCFKVDFSEQEKSTQIYVSRCCVWFLSADVYSLSCLVFGDQHVSRGKTGVTVGAPFYFLFIKLCDHQFLLL